MTENRAATFALTLRLRPSIGRLLEDTAKKTGLSKTSVLVVALRQYAKSEGVEERGEDITAED
jgi:predicted transcriptional regulator